MRKILVAIDGSDTALRALDFAVQQARYEPPASLHLLTVQSTVSASTAWQIYVTAERLQQIAKERASGIFEAATARVKKAGCSFEFEQLAGEPAEAIARRAAELGCESIVMGTHGLGQLGVLIMGSVAQRVVHQATVPVTLVK